jgi:hypothetical protein
MTIAPPDGLTRALQLAAEGSSSLEYTHAPTVADKKKARDLFKRATKIMDSIVGLEEESIYSTGPVPMDECEARYNDPSNYSIELPEVANAIVADETPLLPCPDLVGGFDQLGTNSQSAIFEAAGDDLGARCPSEAGWWAPWEAAFAEARLDTYARLIYALEHREPASVALPTDEEMATWRAQFAPALRPYPAVMATFATWEEEDAALEFERRLDVLAEAGDGGAAYDDWDGAWDADHADAFLRLLLAEEREPKTFTLPTDEELATWLAQFEPLAEEGQAVDPESGAVDRTELFCQKLEELCDAGVTESGLKRKNWKKASEAWGAAYELDPTGTLDKLFWALTKANVSWAIPTDEEVAA